jgi:hypothetical protein
MSYRPANGSEGEQFLRQTCCKCVHDHHWHNDGGGGETGESCPILMRSLTENIAVDEWDIHTNGTATCTGFSKCECGTRAAA